MDRHTPFNQLSGTDQIASLNSYVQSAYFRRSRQLPANLATMVATLKNDLLKHLGGIPVGTLDDAITTATLDNDQPLSVAFFFAAAKKSWYQPKTNMHGWDDQDNRRPDLEGDTIALLDTCASMLAQMDAHEKEGMKVAKHANVAGVVTPLPAFNPMREYDYLVMRRQLGGETWTHFFSDALLAVNTERMDSHHHRLSREEAAKDPEVLAQARRLAVLDWLRASNTQGRKPSDILTPTVDETTYSMFRRTSA